jgi:transposase
MPAKYVRPYSKGQKNDFRDAEAIAEAVRRQTMKFVATKTADQLDLQALHRVRERLVSQRTGARAGTDRSCGDRRRHLGVDRRHRGHGQRAGAAGWACSIWEA